MSNDSDKKLLKEETEEEKTERWGLPEYDINQLLKEAEAEDAIKKIEEHKIDAEAFWELAEDEFKDKLGIETFGTLKLLMLRIEEIKEEHKKLMEKRDKDKKKMSDEERKNMKKLMTNENDDG